MAREGKKRLAVDTPIELHKKLREMAKKYNITISAYVMIVLIERLKNESDWDNKKYI